MAEALETENIEIDEFTKKAGINLTLLRSKYLQGDTYAELAAFFQVSEQTIGNHVKKMDLIGKRNYRTTRKNVYICPICGREEISKHDAVMWSCKKCNYFGNYVFKKKVVNRFKTSNPMPKHLKKRIEEHEGLSDGETVFKQ